MNENFSNGLQKLYNCVSKGLGSIMIPQEVRNIIDKEAKQIDKPCVREHQPNSPKRSNSFRNNLKTSK